MICPVPKKGGVSKLCRSISGPPIGLCVTYARNECMRPDRPATIFGGEDPDGWYLASWGPLGTSLILSQIEHESTTRDGLWSNFGALICLL